MTKRQRKPAFASLTIRIIQYIAGFFVLTFGVVMILRSGLGAGAWDAAVANLAALLGITLGTASALINLTHMTVLIIFRKSLKYIGVLMPIAGLGLTIDFWNIIVFGPVDFTGVTLFVKLVMYGGGLMLLTFGLALIVHANFIASTVDELMLLVMDLLKTNKILLIRLAIEGAAVLLAIIFGLIAGIGFGAINIGTIIVTITLPPILAFQLYWVGNLLFQKEIRSDFNV